MTTPTHALSHAPDGLEGVVVATTGIGDVRGEEGFFHYRGYPAPDLAMSRSFEAVWHLLHRGHLPDSAELSAFADHTGALRTLAPEVLEALPHVVAAGSMMSALRTLVSLAGQDAGSWLDLPAGRREQDALGLVARVPALVAAAWRIRQRLSPIAPDRSRGLADDYLRMLTGRPADARAVRALERYLLLTIDHGFNASTFAARVVASTGADLTAAAVAGIGALAGPLHGGAPSRVIEMLQEIGSPERAPSWVEASLASGRRIMGFGHRVYRTEDPRSAVLKRTALELGGPMVSLAVDVERLVLEILDRRYPERRLRTNVEYYAGVVLHEIGMPPELYPPTFAVSRMAGWMAHVLEQIERNRIIRPASVYAGPLHRTAGACC